MAYPSNTDLKNYLTISGSGEDALLTTLINAAISLVEVSTGRDWVNASNSDKKFYKSMKRCFPDEHTLLFHTDLASLNTLTHPAYGALTVNTHFYLLATNLTNYGVVLHEYNWSFPNATDAVIVNGAWGVTADVPAALFQLIIEIGAYFYNARNTGQAGDFQLASPKAGVIVRSSDLPPHIQTRLEVFRR